MITPTSTSKVCSCGAKSGTCYKETHSHSYTCTSGYSTGCSNGYSATASKKCSCGATSGTCYNCCHSGYKYACSGTGYSGGSGSACGGKYESCTCASGYSWNGSSCEKSTVTITVKTNYGGGEYSYCGAGPFLAPDYKAPGASYYTSFPRAECSGQIDVTSLTVTAGGELRITANPYVGLSGCGVAYPYSGFGSCTAYAGSDVKSRYYECKFTITTDETIVFGYCCESTNLL